MSPIIQLVNEMRALVYSVPVVQSISEIVVALVADPMKEALAKVPSSSLNEITAVYKRMVRELETASDLAEKNFSATVSFMNESAQKMREVVKEYVPLEMLLQIGLLLILPLTGLPAGLVLILICEEEKTLQSDLAIEMVSMSQVDEVEEKGEEEALTPNYSIQ